MPVAIFCFYEGGGGASYLCTKYLYINIWPIHYNCIFQSSIFSLKIQLCRASFASLCDTLLPMNDSLRLLVYYFSTVIRGWVSPRYLYAFPKSSKCYCAARFTRWAVFISLIYVYLLFQPVPYTSYLTCSKCNGNNQPYSKYCSSCACHIDAPPRTRWAISNLFSVTGKQ